MRRRVTFLCRPVRVILFLGLRCDGSLLEVVLCIMALARLGSCYWCYGTFGCFGLGSYNVAFCRCGACSQFVCTWLPHDVISRCPEAWCFIFAMLYYCIEDWVRCDRILVVQLVVVLCCLVYVKSFQCIQHGAFPCGVQHCHAFLH